MARVLVTNPPDAPGPVLELKLSERNVLALLTKLYTPGSACAVDCHDVAEELGFICARLRVEPDELHYFASPTREGAAPGPMHPLTECVLIAVRTAIAEFMADTDTEGWRP
jgi:hypothetical protein